jgi:hypothetical protein
MMMVVYFCSLFPNKMSQTALVPSSTPDIDIRQDARSSRLSLKNSKEEDLRKILLKDARTKCQDTMKEMAVCAKEKGYMVVFECRKQNQSSECLMFIDLNIKLFFLTKFRSVIDCIGRHYNETEFEKVLAAKGYDITNRPTKGYRL